MSTTNHMMKFAAVGLVAVGLVAMTTNTREENFFSQADNQSYPIVYSYTIYDENGNVVGHDVDTCNVGPFVTVPPLTVGQYDEYPAYACTDRGPYLPSDWPY